MTTATDCRSEIGITVGLIDAIISIGRILARRDLSASETVEALKDLRNDEALTAVLSPASGWISVDERLPADGDTVLTWYVGLDGYGKPHLVTSWHSSLSRCTHWQPLAAPPIADREPA